MKDQQEFESRLNSLLKQKSVEIKSAEESLGISSEEYNKIVDKCIFEGGFVEDFAEVNHINPSEFDKRLNALLKEFEDIPKEELACTLRFYLDVVRLDDLRERKPVCKMEATGTLKELIDNIDEEELAEEKKLMLDSLKGILYPGWHCGYQRDDDDMTVEIEGESENLLDAVYMLFVKYSELNYQPW